jgi:hypothetical protein
MKPGNIMGRVDDARFLIAATRSWLSCEALSVGWGGDGDGDVMAMMMMFLVGWGPSKRKLKISLYGALRPFCWREFLYR